MCLVDFFSSTNSYKWNCWVKSSYTFKILIVPNCPPKGLTNYTSTMHKIASFPTSLPTECCQTLHVLLTWWVKNDLILICISFIVSEVEHLFMCLKTLAFVEENPMRKNEKQWLGKEQKTRRGWGWRRRGKNFKEVEEGVRDTVRCCKEAR